AILHLSAPGNVFRTAPGPKIPFDVPARGGAGRKAPMINVGALGCVAGHQPLAVKPAKDLAGMLRSSKIVIDGFAIEKGESVIVGISVDVDACNEASCFRVPESAIALRLYFPGMPFEHRWIKHQSAARHLPLRMSSNLLFKLGHRAQG